MSPRTRILVGAAALVLATVAAYLPALRGGFVWDDETWVAANPLLVEPDGLWRIWFSDDQPSQYFPLVYTTFRLEYALWGAEPFGFHLTNVVLHAINVLLVWGLLARLRIPAAWASAAIFALHPVQVESVAWITERKNVLMLLFFALSLGAWLRFVDRSAPSRPARGAYLLSLGLHVAALLSKTTACTMPAALVLTLWLRRIRVDRRRWLQIAPYVLLGLAAGLLTLWWERHHQGTWPDTVHAGLLERLLVASRAVWFYLGKLVWPAELTFSYPRWSVDPADPVLWLWPALCLASAWALWRWRRAIGRGPIAAVVFFVATLSPVLGFFMLYTFVYTWVADHYQYVACVGPIALAAAAGHLLARRFGASGRRVGATALLVLLALLGTLTWRQCGAYTSRESLWRDTLRKNPHSWLAHNNLATALRLQGRIDEAAEHYRRALRLDRDLRGSGGRIHFNLADMLGAQGNHVAAIRHYRMALDEFPENFMAHNNLANALLRLGRPEEAIGHYRAAIEIDPGYAVAHSNLAEVLRGQGRLDEAERHYRLALAAAPRHESALKGLAVTLTALGRTGEAIEHYRTVLELRPDDADVHHNLGNALRSRGELAQAARHYRRALKVNPGDELTRNNLGLVLYLQGDLEGAIGQLRAAVRASPDYADGHYNLGNLLRFAGAAEQAAAHYRRALELDPSHAKARGELDRLGDPGDISSFP